MIACYSAACGVFLLFVSEGEADDELEEGDILEGINPAHNPVGLTTPRRSTVLCRRYTEGLKGGPETSSVIVTNPQ